MTEYQINMNDSSFKSLCESRGDEDFQFYKLLFEIGFAKDPIRNAKRLGIAIMSPYKAEELIKEAVQDINGWLLHPNDGTDMAIGLEKAQKFLKGLFYMENVFPFSMIKESLEKAFLDVQGALQGTELDLEAVQNWNVFKEKAGMIDFMPFGKYSVGLYINTSDIKEAK